MTGSQGEDEDGARRLRLPRAPSMGEDMGAANLLAAGNSTLTATSSLASCAEVAQSSVDAPLTLLTGLLCGDDLQPFLFVMSTWWKALRGGSEDAAQF